MKLNYLKLYQKLKIKNLLVLTFTSYFTFCSCRKSTEDKIVDFLQSNISDTLILKDITDFEWDEVWIVSPSQHSFDPLHKLEEKGINLKNLKNKDFYSRQYSIQTISLQ